VVNRIDSAGHLRDPRVFAEQVRLLFRELPMAAFATSLTAVVIVAGLWGHAPGAWLAAWLSSVLANAAWQLRTLARFRAAGDAIADHRTWARRWVAGMAVGGLLLGLAGYLFVDPASLFHELLMLVVLFGMASGMVPLLSHHRHALFWFLVPAIGPLALRLAAEGGTHALLAIVLALVLVMMIVLGRYYGRAMERSLAIRFDNLDLIEALAAETRRVEAARVLADAAREQAERSREQTEVARARADADRAAAEAARQQAETANRAKTQFFAAASHDLRQPLHAMGLFAAALAEKVRDPGVVDVVHSINASVEALETLFNELLDISKIDAGVIQARPADFALQPLFERLQREFGPEAADRDLDLRFVSTGHCLRSDPVLVERILRNLVANALRYTREGGIVVGCRPRGTRRVLEVRDSGIGIAADHLPKVFDEFYQVGNVERDRRKGLGLGLSIVQRLVALLDGEIAVRSAPGKGTVFSVTLDAGRVAASSTIQPMVAPTGDLGGARIVVIDDEPTVVAGMDVLLSGWGARVVGSESIEDGLAAIEAESAPPDLLLVDYRLRDGRNGLDGIAAIRARFGDHLPAILITGSTSPDLLARAREIGVHLLSKPVMPAKLRALIGFTLKRPSAAY